MHAVSSSSTLHCTIPQLNPSPALQDVAKVLSRRIPGKHASVVETAPLIVALLMDKPRTARELSVDAAIHISTVKRWLAAFEAAGVLTTAPHPTQRVGVTGEPVRVWRLHHPKFAA